MNEHGFSRWLSQKLKPVCYVWKVNDNFAGGVPDFYLSGIKNDLWVEVKYIKLPKRPSTVLTFGLSELQKLWLRERHKEGRNVAVLIGADNGSAMLYHAPFWDRQIFQSDYLLDAEPKKELIPLLDSLVNGHT